MVINSSVLMTTAMTTGLAGAVGDTFAGMSEAVAGALGDDAAIKKGIELREEASRNISAAMLQQLKDSLAEMSAQISGKIGSLTDEERAELIEDINDESYSVALDSIKNTDFGLPKITESLGEAELAKYLNIAEKEPRFGAIMESVLSAKPPRAFMRGTKTSSITEDMPEAPPAPIAPDVINELPARYEFPPNFTSTITFPCNDGIRLHWSSTHKGIIENYGIRVESSEFGDHGTVTSCRSNPDGAQDINPEDGRITVTMTNLEAFPMTVEISMKIKPQT